MDWRDSDLYDDKRLLVRKHTLKKMIKKRKERIIQNQLEIKEFQKEMVEVNRNLKLYSKLWKVNPQIKHKPQKKKLKDGSVSTYMYHQMEINTFWGSGIMYVSIGVDDIYKTKTDDEWKEFGRKRYKQKLTNLDEESMKEVFTDLYGKSIKK